MRRVLSLFFVILALFVSFCHGSFLAYNDCIRGGGDTTAANVTNWTIYNNYTSNTTGNLIDYSTGLPTPVTATFTWNSSAGLATSEVSGSEDGISQPRPGTPAYEIFGGIVDFSSRLIYYGGFGWWVEIEFTGLNASTNYTFVTTAIRASDYTDRLTLFTISGHVSAVNNSSDGIYDKNGNTSILLAGGNHRDTTGYVVRWDEIQVADQGDGTGSFTVRAEATGSNYRAYPFGGFMLEETGNAAPTINAGQDQTIHLPKEYLTLSGSVSDDGQGEPEGYLQSTWSQISGPGTVEFTPDIHQPEVTVRFPAAGEYTLQLSATDGDLSASDEVVITVAEPVCPVGDVDGDCIVSLTDLELLGLKWLDDTASSADLDGDARVTIKELSLLGQSWQDDWTGSLMVTILPTEAAAAGAKWRVDGGPWQSSGVTLSPLAEGSHAIEYSAVTGWVAPETEAIQITRQQTTVTSGAYTVPEQTLAISEFMAVNSTVLDLRPVPSVNLSTSVDGEPAYDDWIEIENLTDETVSLEGWYLTDNPDNLTKWRFPSGYSVPAQGHLVVWASNKDTEKYGYPFIDDYGTLHTNFDLSIGGEYLALVRPDGLFVEHAYNDYPKQRGLVSYGPAYGDLDTVGYFTSPTFGNDNTGIYDGLVEDTKFSADRGFYDSPFTVAITCGTPDAVIRYTIDGSEPTATTGTVYSGPVSIATTTCLRAAAFKPGYLASDIDTQTYIFLDDVLTQATNPSTGVQVVPDGYPTTWPGGSHSGSVTGDYQVDPDIVDPSGLFGAQYASTIKDDLKAVPSLSIVAPIDSLFGSSGIYINEAQDGTERAGSVELIDPNGVEFFQTNCGIRMQGGASQVAGGTTLNRWKSYKLSFRLMFRGIFGGQLDYPLYGDEGADTYNTIVLDSRPQNSWVHDNATQRQRAEYVRDQVSSDIQLAMGGYACHGRPFHVYVNGLYWGLYWMHERPDGAFAASYLGGDKEDYDVVKHVYNNAISGSYEDYVAMFSLSASSPDEVTAFENLKQKLDVPDFINYLLANYYLGNGDWDHKNWYATHNRFDPEGRWRWHMWDGEHVMDDGTFTATDATTKNNSMAPTGLQWKWIGNDEYRMAFADQVHKQFFHDGALMADQFAPLFTRLTDWIDRAVVGESARWGDNRRSSEPYTRNNEWIAEVNRLLTTFIPTRRDIVLAQFTSKSPAWYPLTAAPEFYINSTAQYGGDVTTGSSLTMSNGGNTIYYTLDGTDPRLPGGAVNTTATAYSGAVTLTKATLVKARAFSGSEWSALAEAVFNTDPVVESLRITELMYHPADPNHEFIELKNIGAAAINLNLVQFTKGIDHVFGDVSLAADAYLLLVKNKTAFEAYYTALPSGAQVVQWDEGSLDNDGDKVKIKDALGRTIQLFSYKDGWYELTDGPGFSLSIRDPLGDLLLWDEKEGWRASLYQDGTPGAADAVLAAGSIVVNELLAHSHATEPDWIELYNTTGQDIHIGGWLLSDDDSDDVTIMKYEIPDGTVIKAHDYYVFVEDETFGNVSAAGCNIAFGLSEAGETVYLYSGENGELTGYYQTEENFDASETGVTFGRYEKAELSGGYDFVRMAWPTQGSANSGPLIPAVVITEIHYNPTGGSDYEFVELYNRSGAGVTLMTDVTTETSPGVFVTESLPWRLEGTGFEFSANTVIGAGEFIIVAKDPSVYSALTCDVYGPYDGKLDNGGEQIEIQMPGDLEYGQSRYWIPIEKIDYDNETPWPTSPDDAGDSLQRIDAAAYGRDYSNWQAGSPDPGE